MPNIDLNILNQRQTPAFYADTFANRPPAGFVGRIFVSTNTFEFFRDNGTTYDLIGGPGTSTITGSGANGQVSFWNGASTITGSNDLFFDAVNGHLGINTITPGTALDVKHDQNTVVQLEQVTATNDIRIAFINNGVGLWRIGSFYNAGANDFGLFDIAAAAQPVTVKRTTGQVLIGTSTVGSGKLIVASTTSDNGIQIAGTTAPSLRIDNAVTGPSLRMGLGIATTTNDFIQNSAAGEVCIFSAGTTPQPITFGIYDTGIGFVVQAARLSAARNFLIGTTTDNGQKLQVSGTSLITGAASFLSSITTSGGILFTGATNSFAVASIYRNANKIFFGGDTGGYLFQSSTNVNLLTILDSGASTYFNSVTTNEFFQAIKNTRNIYINPEADFGLGALPTIQVISNHGLQFATNNSIRGLFTASGNLLIGTTIDAGFKLQVNGRSQTSGNTCFIGQVSIASGATQTIYTIPSTTNAAGIYHIFVGVTAGSQIYTASGIVTASSYNADAVFSSIYDGANVTLQLTGMNIEIVNNGFGTFNWNYTIHFMPLISTP